MNMKKSKTERMESESIPKLIIGFSLSTFVALVFNSLYTVTDALFVSRAVGDNAMGGVSLILPFVVFQSAIASAVGSGAAAVVSLELGKNNPKKAGNAAYNAMLIFYVSAAVITVIGFIAMEPTLRLLGVTDELYSAAKEYYTIVLAGNIFSTGFSSVIRAEGKMTYALLIWVIPVSVNIILDAVFILAFGWGVVGSAAATVICQITSASMSVLFFSKFTSLDFSERCFSKTLCKDIVSIGIPSVVQIGSLSVLTLIVNNALSVVSGTEGVNSFAYIGKIITFAVVPFTAFSMALAPVAGYNYGFGNRKRVKKAFGFCVLLCFVYSLLALISIELFSDFFISVFTENKNTIKIASQGLKSVAFALPFSFLPLLTACLFQAHGKMLVPFVLYCITPASAAVLMKVFSVRLGLSGIWAAYVISSAFSCAVSSAVFFIDLKNERKHEV